VQLERPFKSTLINEKQQWRNQPPIDLQEENPLRSTLVKEMQV
jgi:hypothetical protein